MIFGVLWVEVKFNMCLIPQKQGPMLTITNIIYTLDPFEVVFVLLDVDKPIVNKIESC